MDWRGDVVLRECFEADAHVWRDEHGAAHEQMPPIHRWTDESPVIGWITRNADGADSRESMTGTPSV